jgi:hypothetical protein
MEVELLRTLCPAFPSDFLFPVVPMSFFMWTRHFFYRPMEGYDTC